MKKNILLLFSILFSVILNAQVNEIEEEFWNIRIDNIDLDTWTSLSANGIDIIEKTNFTVVQLDEEEDSDYKYKIFKLSNGITVDFHTDISESSRYTMSGMQLVSGNLIKINTELISIGDSISKLGDVQKIEHPKENKGVVSYSPDLRSGCYLSIYYNLTSGLITNVEYSENFF